MISFKTFLTEINFDDTIYSKAASHKTASVNIDDLEWTPFPVRLDVPGFSWKWRHYGKDFKLVVIDDKKKRSVMMIYLVSQTKSVPGGKLIGVETFSLSTREEYRGKGLPLAVYSGLIKNGQVLFSSKAQTTGSRKLWQNLVNSNIGEVFVMVSGDDVSWYSSRFGDDKLLKPNVLLTGPLDKLDDEAYATHNMQWVIVPKNLPGLDVLKDKALNIAD